ncbi:Coiled-coil and C2 domain-containing protein 1B, variant 2 [Schistosoma haematobium]|uniref:Coiled-coil and C2 domain-containing protein 1B, variant 2 n=2 Tax=Schistosoma haematobium TaxID=6185 RepID=A0A922LR51_SCHHA|nr:Coiled-coil and C2 domain-containing protein 1B, variant 2 [Schistosoma haematobium]KAH9591807.1 Coiled-coil and C2 domain-containing protein 1B, variant 2 [Schistosoma haematobium]
MQWKSKKIEAKDTTFNPDNIGDIDFSSEDLEQELLDLLHDDPTLEISNKSSSFDQDEKNCDEDDELLLAELVKSMESGKSPVPNRANKMDELEINEDIFGNQKTSTGSTSKLPHQTSGFEGSDFGSSLLSSPRNSGLTTNSKNGTNCDNDDELLLAELVKSMESGKSPVSNRANKMDELEVNEGDIFDDHKISTSNTSNSGSVTNPKVPSNNNALGNSSGSTLKPTAADVKPDIRQAVLDYINPKTSNSGLDLLKNRHKEYKLAALKARDTGQLGKAKELLEASKCIGEAIVNIEAGKETFDPETDLPPPPSEYEFSNEGDPNNETVIAQPPPSSQPVKSTIPDIMKTSIVCTENILARITYYKEKLKEITNDDSKKRRYNRILTRYDEGLRACERGVTSFEFEELVPPPGYPPLTDRSKLSKNVKLSNNDPKISLAKPSSGHPIRSKTEAIVELLTKRQDELKQAAKAAKQSGNIELAKTYIRSVLGMNQMIQAAEAGLPIDLTQLPRPPALTDSNPSRPILSGLKCDPPVKYAVAFNSLSGDQLFKTYSEILSEQEQLINNLINQHRRNGGANAHSILSKLSDLLSVNTCIKKLLSKYNQHVSNLTAYFEYANLPKCNLNAELADDILEVSNIHGIAYPLPSHYSNIDTYVEVEFSLNNANPPMKLSTNVVKSSSEPIYSQSVKEFRVNTKSHSYRRFVQNNRCLKATVYYNRGIFRSWGVLGITEIPLTGLVQSATVTHVGDLKEGRKVVGGRLQVQLRQRESLSGETVVYQQQPWLLLSAPKQINESPKLIEIENSKNNPVSSSSLSTPKQTDSPRSIRSENIRHSPVPSISSKQTNSPKPIRIEYAMNNPISSSSSSFVSTKATNSVSSSSSRVVIVRNIDNS